METLDSVDIFLEAKQRRRLFHGSLPAAAVAAILMSRLEELRSEFYASKLFMKRSRLERHTYPFHVLNPVEASATP